MWNIEGTKSGKHIWGDRCKQPKAPPFWTPTVLCEYPESPKTSRETQNELFKEFELSTLFCYYLVM